MKRTDTHDIPRQWQEIEAALRRGESFEVLRSGEPVARILPHPAQVAARWDDHLATAVTSRGHQTEDVVRKDRDGSL